MIDLTELDDKLIAYLDANEIEHDECTYGRYDVSCVIRKNGNTMLMFLYPVEDGLMSIPISGGFWLSDDLSKQQNREHDELYPPEWAKYFGWIEVRQSLRFYTSSFWKVLKG